VVGALAAQAEFAVSSSLCHFFVSPGIGENAQFNGSGPGKGSKIRNSVFGQESHELKSES
jgi:hypothetical protein